MRLIYVDFDFEIFILQDDIILLLMFTYKYVYVNREDVQDFKRKRLYLLRKLRKNKKYFHSFQWKWGFIY